jgi:hypothetical protein
MAKGCQQELQFAIRFFKQLSEVNGPSLKVSSDVADKREQVTEYQEGQLKQAVLRPISRVSSPVGSTCRSNGKLQQVSKYLCIQRKSNALLAYDGSLSAWVVLKIAFYAFPTAVLRVECASNIRKNCLPYESYPIRIFVSGFI